jgi:hypothetical protein
LTVFSVLKCVLENTVESKVMLIEGLVLVAAKASASRRLHAASSPDPGAVCGLQCEAAPASSSAVVTTKNCVCATEATALPANKASRQKYERRRRDLRAIIVIGIGKTPLLDIELCSQNLERAARFWEKTVCPALIPDDPKSAPVAAQQD